MMRKFKAGDVVYHKADLKRGVITKLFEPGDYDYRVDWGSGFIRNHKEGDLYSKEEGEKLEITVKQIEKGEIKPKIGFKI